MRFKFVPLYTTGAGGARTDAANGSGDAFWENALHNPRMSRRLTLGRKWSSTNGRNWMMLPEVKSARLLWRRGERTGTNPESARYARS